MTISVARKRVTVFAALLLASLPSAANSHQRAPKADAAARAMDPFFLEGVLTQGGFARGIAPAGTVALHLDDQSVPIGSDMAFLIAFDRDASPSATLTATLKNGTKVTQNLVIGPRAWPISHLKTLPKFPVPKPEFQRMRAGELKQIEDARKQRIESDGWRSAFAWPLTGRISTRFGSQRIYAGEPGAYHSGIDIARPTGTLVRAPADGVVTLATAHPFSLEGNLIILDHGGGLSSALMHLSRIDVTVGAHVKKGQALGTVGSTGRSTGPHLHWGLRWYKYRIDPLLIAGEMRPSE